MTGLRVKSDDDAISFPSKDCFTALTMTSSLEVADLIEGRGAACYALFCEPRRDLSIVTADNTEVPERKGTISRPRVDTPGVAAPLARA